MLSDRDLRLAMTPGKLPPNRRHEDPLVIVPEPRDEAIQPASIDLRLGNKFIYWTRNHDAPTGWDKITTETDTFWLKPNQFILAQTLEYVEIPRHLAAQVDGKSTLGRQGVTAHVTAGFIDPGFAGIITLEIKHLGYEGVRLNFGMDVCQLLVHRLSSPALRPYGHPDLKSRYQGQTGVTAARAPRA